MNQPVQIVADIGGTNARFAYVHANSDVLQGIEVFPCAEFPFFIDAIRTYMANNQFKSVDKICLAVASPMEGDWVDLLNNHWAFSRSELQEALQVSLTIINDFSAQVLCVKGLDESEIKWLGSPRPSGDHVTAVVGPGTGLGVSAMTPDGSILPSEGGHVAFAPVNDHQIALLQQLWRRYERVSVERALSGAGLANLYWANTCLDNDERELIAPEVTSGAYAGDVHCVRAVEDFCSILASVSGDVALMMGATGGVYLSGGILPRLLDLLDEEQFRTTFEEKGRFSEILSKIPLGIILAKQPGLRGCVAALRLNIQGQG